MLRYAGSLPSRPKPLVAIPISLTWVGTCLVRSCNPLLLPSISSLHLHLSLLSPRQTNSSRIMTITSRRLLSQFKFSLQHYPGLSLNRQQHRCQRDQIWERDRRRFYQRSRDRIHLRRDPLTHIDCVVCMPTQSVATDDSPA
jgi:hypothetical protein